MGELTLRDYLRPIGMTAAVLDKTHMAPNPAGMDRLGIAWDTDIGSQNAQPGFGLYERDDEVNPTPVVKMKSERLGYNTWLNAMGYPGENPWNDHANAAELDEGRMLPGWDIRNRNLPTRIKEEHSETTFMTGRSHDFIEEMGDAPWLCHLSYIKPHLPYMAARAFCRCSAARPSARLQTLYLGPLCGTGCPAHSQRMGSGTICCQPIWG